MMNDKAKHLRTSDYGMLCVIDMLLEMYCCLWCKKGKYKGVTGRYHVKGGDKQGSKEFTGFMPDTGGKKCKHNCCIFLFKTSEKVKYLRLAVCVIWEERERLFIQKLERYIQNKRISMFYNTMTYQKLKLVGSFMSQNLKYKIKDWT